MLPESAERGHAAAAAGGGGTSSGRNWSCRDRRHGGEEERKQEGAALSVAGLNVFLCLFETPAGRCCLHLESCNQRTTPCWTASLQVV